MDEPTSGLDPLMEAAFRDWINKEERARGRTVLLSSHILAEVEALADRVSIIRAGRIVESGTLAELRHLTRTSVTAELAAPPDGLLELPGVHNLEVDGTRVRLQVDPASLDGVLRQLSAVGVRSLVSQPPTLEELFLRHYGDQATPCRGAGMSAQSSRAETTSGTGVLLRFLLRLDRFRLPWWLLGAGLLVGYQSAGSQSIYDTPRT